MQEFLEIDKILQFIQDELVNNTLKLMMSQKNEKTYSNKSNAVVDDPTYTQEQRQLYKDSLENLKTDGKRRLGIL